MLNSQLKNLNTDFTLSNCLFGSVKLTKNVNLDKYKYTGYGIEFDSSSEFLSTDGSFGENKNKDILIFCEGRTQGLGDTTLAINILLILHNQSGKKVVLSLQ